MKRYHVIVHGRVQGVMFRHNAGKIADRLNVTGWVRNNPNGTVEAVFEGEEEALEKIINWCKKGTLGARIDKVDIKEEPYKGEFEAFRITI